MGRHCLELRVRNLQNSMSQIGLYPLWALVGEFPKVWDFEKVKKIMRRLLRNRPPYSLFKRIERF